MPSNEFYDSSGAPATSSDIDSSVLRAEFDAIEEGFKKLPVMAGKNSLPVFVNSGGTGLEAITADNARAALAAEGTTKKDASDGYVGLTLFKINFKNALNSFISFLTNSNTAVRTYTFPDKDGTVAMTADVALKAPIDTPTFTGAASFTGAVSGVTKSMVGLSNVDNTSDANKPVSTAQATAIGLKLDASGYTAADVLTKIKTVDGVSSGLDADLLDGAEGALYARLASPNFTGSPSAPTPVVTDNGTSLATTAFVNNILSGSAATTGYQKFPDGMIIQWGVQTTHATPGTAIAVPFLVGFPTACAVRVPGGNISANVWTTNTATPLTSFNIFASVANVYSQWIAIGY